MSWKITDRINTHSIFCRSAIQNYVFIIIIKLLGFCGHVFYVFLFFMELSYHKNVFTEKIVLKGTLVLLKIVFTMLLSGFDPSEHKLKLW